jgi:GNAT superfamily N-acetyltransferase
MGSRVIPFDPAVAPEDLIEAYLDFDERGFRELEPKDPLPKREERAARLREPYPYGKKAGWLVLTDLEDREAVIGEGWVRFCTEQTPGYPQGRHIAKMDVRVDQRFRRQGLGTKLLRVLVDEAIGHGGITTVEAYSFLECGWGFCGKFGGRLALEAAQNRLALTDVDWPMIEAWQADGERRNEGVKILTFEKVPEEMLGPFVGLYNDIVDMVPLGELEARSRVTPESRREEEQRAKEHGTRWWTKATREPDGRISGLTEVVHFPATPYRLEQEITGVGVEFRGRGLGKWLKADMLLFVRDRLPEVQYINTGNADANAPMMAINRRMGFRRHLTERCFKFDLHEMGSLLDGSVHQGGDGPV